MCKKTIQTNHEKSRNSLTLIKYFNNNISIVFKHSYILKYWSYDILSIRKRISSIFKTHFLYFLIYLAEKSDISERLKNLKNSKFWKNWNLKISKFFWKNLEHFPKKSQNRKSNIFFSKIEVSTFFVFHREKYVFMISRTFLLNTPSCPFCTFVMFFSRLPAIPPMSHFSFMGKILTIVMDI